MRSAAEHRRRSGYSLVELVAVISVLAVMAATAIPAVNSLGDTRASALVSGVGDALRRARAGAVGLGAPCGVRFSMSKQTYELLVLEDLDPVPMRDALGRETEPAPIDPAAVIELDSVTGGVSGGASPEVWFDETGAPADTSQSDAAPVITRDTVLRFSNGATITIRGASGKIE